MLVKPRLVLDGEPGAGHARDAPPQRGPAAAACSRACSGPTGTAPEAAVPGYDLAGKTGTAAEARARRLLGDASTSPRSSASRPRRDAKLLVAVIVDEPGGGVYAGGEVAAPAFEKIASFALPYLGIAPK